MVVEKMLTNQGYKCLLVDSGSDALALIAEKKPNLVLMDIQMPNMDGLTATRKIREKPEFQELPIIAMTAHAMIGDYEKSISAGMNDHIVKPFVPKDF